VDALEKEYLENVERSKRSEDRSRFFFIGWYFAFALVLAVIGMAVDDFSLRSVLALIPVLGTAGILPAIWAAKRFQRWFDDRNVVVTTTERERTYRAPLVMTSEPQQPVSRMRHVIASIPLAMAIFFGAVMEMTSRRTSLTESFVVVSIMAVLLGIGVAVRAVYRGWRARRNARLELKWEKWLDSADSCEVGPRKWTK